MKKKKHVSTLNCVLCSKTIFSYTYYIKLSTWCNTKEIQFYQAKSYPKKTTSSEKKESSFLFLILKVKVKKQNNYFWNNFEGIEIIEPSTCAITFNLYWLYTVCVGCLLVWPIFFWIFLSLQK